MLFRAVMHIYACPVYTREHRKIQEIHSETYFLKRFPPFKRLKRVSQSCCHFIYCTLCNTVSFNSSCALPTAGLVNIELFLLQTTYCMWKEKLFSSSRSFYLHSQSLFRKSYFLELVMKGSLNTSLSSTIKSSSPAGMRRLRYKHQDENKIKDIVFLKFWS